MSDQQDDWDAEVCTDFRRRVGALARKVRLVHGKESVARQGAKRKRKEARAAQHMLEGYIAAADHGEHHHDDVEFVREVRRLTVVVQEAQQAESEARQGWKAEVIKRRHIQLELQQLIANWTAPLPLFDQGRRKSC